MKHLNQDIPVGFERATGVVEGRRRCLNTECQKTYPVTDHALQQQCPHCECMVTENLDQHAG